MNAPLVLYVLATLDAAFIGYRDGAARCARLHKRDHVRKSLLRGAAWGQLAVLVAAISIAAAMALAPDPWAMWDDYARAAERMVWIYAPYAAVIVVTLLVRLLPSVDAKSLAAVMVFGPLHLLRPAVVIAGATLAILAVPRTAVIAIVVLVCVMMLGLERLLDLRRRRRRGARVL